MSPLLCLTLIELKCTFNDSQIAQRFCTFLASGLGIRPVSFCNKYFFRDVRDLYDLNYYNRLIVWILSPYSSYNTN